MSVPEKPLTRKEQYLSAMAGLSTEIPEKPITREEQYLDQIVKNLDPATAGVTSFNGRTGAVTPQADDYTAEMIGASSVIFDGDTMVIS